MDGINGRRKNKNVSMCVCLSVCVCVCECVNEILTLIFCVRTLSDISTYTINGWMSLMDVINGRH